MLAYSLVPSMDSCSLVKAYPLKPLGAGIAMFVASVMLARLKEQDGPIRAGKIIEEKTK